MLRKAKDKKITVLHEMFNGKGDFTQYHIITQDEMNGVGRLFADCSLDVGGVVGSHTHHGDSEVCYFISGKGRVTDDTEVIEVGPGDVNYCPDGHLHKIENIGEEPLRYLAIILYTK